MSPLPSTVPSPLPSTVPSTVQPKRPMQLVAGSGLMVAAAVPFLVLAALLLAGSTSRLERVTVGLPTLVVGVLGHRVSAAAVGFGAAGYVLLAVLAGVGSRWTRTGVVVLAGMFDAGLVMVVLAGVPTPSRLLAGIAVVLASLAGVVLCYQPAVERYLGPGGEPGVVPVAESA